MKKLSSAEKKVIIEISQLEHHVLENIFTEGGLDKEYLKSIDNEISHYDFIDNLLDTNNYFMRLASDPLLIYDIEETEGSIFNKVLKILSNKYYKDPIDLEACKSLLYLLREYDDYDEEIQDERLPKEIFTLGETKNIEYKPSLLYSFIKAKGSIDVTYIVAKAICGFMNSDGGKILIGVRDDGKIQGIDFDYKLFEGDILRKRDRFRLTFDNLVNHFFDPSVRTLIHTAIEEIEGKDICVVSVGESNSTPIFLRNRSYNQETKRYDIIKKEFYIRGEASTLQLVDIEDIVKYITNKWRY